MDSQSHIEKKKRKIKLDVLVGTLGLLIAILALLFGDNLVGRIREKEPTSSSDHVTTSSFFNSDADVETTCDTYPVITTTKLVTTTQNLTTAQTPITTQKPTTTRKPTTTITKPSGKNKIIVPAVLGQNEIEAINTLKAAGFKNIRPVTRSSVLGFVTPGTVAEQTPFANTSAYPDDEIIIFVIE